MDNITEILTVVSNFGATGVAFLWLNWTIGVLRDMQKKLDATQAKLEDCLKDCHRAEDSTKRTFTDKQ